MTELADRGKGIRAVGSDADLRPWLLIGFRGQSHVLELVEFARIGERIFSPRPFEDFEGLGEALPAFAIRNTICFVSTREPAAPDAEDKPTMTDLIDCSGLFADPQRVAQRQHLHTGTDLDATGARSNSAGDR